MSEKNVIQDKTFEFAVRCIKLCKYLQSEKKEYVLSKQILRSGTSIGASVREAKFSQSKADFIHKMSISLKEANETLYWIDLLIHTEYISGPESQSIRDQSNEIISILSAIVKSSKASLSSVRGKSNS